MKVKRVLIRLYEKLFPIIRSIKFSIKYRFKVLSYKKTISLIKKGKSISRFGDGEFEIIFNNKAPDFQKNDSRLAKKLSDVCVCNDKRLLICIPHTFKRTNDCNKFAKDFWDWWLWEDNHLEKAVNILKISKKKKKIFGDSQITRPYMDWKNKKQSSRKFELLKSIWEGKNILIIEGELTKLGVGNDLFDKAENIRRIIAPSRNAFDKYDDILNFVRANVQQEELILIALGPTATVLSCDLTTLGFHALDIGHIDIEYEWFLMGAQSKVSIEGKYVQELHANHTENKHDSMYDSQIIKVIRS